MSSHFSGVISISAESDFYSQTTRVELSVDHATSPETVHSLAGCSASEGGNQQVDGSRAATDSIRLLQDLKMELARVQRSLRLSLEAKLTSLVGQNLHTLAANRELATAIQTLLDSHSLRIECPQCGHPAILRVSPRKGMPGGAFVLDHTIEGRRTFHGGTAEVPRIRLMSKPSRRLSRRA